MMLNIKILASLLIAFLASPKTGVGAEDTTAICRVCCDDCGTPDQFADECFTMGGDLMIGQEGDDEYSCTWFEESRVSCDEGLTATYSMARSSTSGSLVVKQNENPPCLPPKFQLKTTGCNRKLRG